jgi:hypothetical protein
MSRRRITMRLCGERTVAQWADAQLVRTDAQGEDICLGRGWTDAQGFNGINEKSRLKCASFRVNESGNQKIRGR